MKTAKTTVRARPQTSLAERFLPMAKFFVSAVLSRPLDGLLVVLVLLVVADSAVEDGSTKEDGDGDEDEVGNEGEDEDEEGSEDATEMANLDDATKVATGCGSSADVG